MTFLVMVKDFAQMAQVHHLAAARAAQEMLTLVGR